MAASKESVTSNNSQQPELREEVSREATYTVEESGTAPDASAEETAAEVRGEELSSDQLLGRIAELEAQIEEAQQRTLRLQADYDNFRRRTRQEKEDFVKYASMKLIEQLLPVVDNFERALSASRVKSDFEALAKGVEMIARQLDQVLAAEGLAAMQAVGQPFNPELHQAIMQVESEEHGEGIVVEEIQKGYTLKDKVLRPAMVKVST